MQDNSVQELVVKNGISVETTKCYVSKSCVLFALRLEALVITNIFQNPRSCRYPDERINLSG
jgi:hypothetical protein